MKIPIISLAILGGQTMMAWSVNHTIAGTLGGLAGYYTGFDPNFSNWDASRLAVGYGPWAVKWLVSKTGVLRTARLGRFLPVSLS